MPWRLIGIIVVVALLLGFIGLNLENTCDLDLWVTEFHDVPVYITIFASFLLGMLFSLPFFMSFIKKKQQKEKPAPDNIKAKESEPPKKTEAPTETKKSLKDRLFPKNDFTTE